MTEQNDTVENHNTVDNTEGLLGQDCICSSGVGVHVGLNLETGACVQCA